MSRPTVNNTINREQKKIDRIIGNSNKKIIIRAHGAIITGCKPFKINTGQNVITTTKSAINKNSLCPSSDRVEQALVQFYIRGYTIFNSNDTTNSHTDNFKDFSKIVLSNSLKARYHFKSHVGTAAGKLINNQTLSFISKRVSSMGDESNIIITLGDGEMITPSIDPIRSYCLSELVDMFGEGTYIVFACRGIQSDPNLVRLTRQISA
jgi:hypothetical protein